MWPQVKAGVTDIIDVRIEWTDDASVHGLQPQLRYHWLGADDHDGDQKDEWFAAGVGAVLEAFGDPTANSPWLRRFESTPSNLAPTDHFDARASIRWLARTQAGASIYERRNVGPRVPRLGPERTIRGIEESRAATARTSDPRRRSGLTDNDGLSGPNWSLIRTLLAALPR